MSQYIPSSTPIPYPNPTPYQSPAQGGNQFIVPGTTGPAVSAAAQPVTTVGNTALFNTGTQVPSRTVNPFGGQVLGVNTNTPPQAQNQNNANPGNGGGNGSGDNNKGVPNPADRSGILAEIDALYNTITGSANKYEANLRSLQPGITDSINATANANFTAGQNQYNQSDRQITTEKGDVAVRDRNAMAEARQALTESGIGFNQRFGRESNMAKALGEYATVGFQKNAAAIRDTTEQSYSKLNELKVQLDEGWKNTQASIKQWTTDALNKAQTDFINQLNQIQSMRDNAATNKSTQTISVLQQLAQTIDNINLTAYSYQQQAIQNFQNSSSYLGALASGLGDYSNSAQGEDANNALTMGDLMKKIAPVSVNGQGNGPQQNPTGSIKKKQEETV